MFCLDSAETIRQDGEGEHRSRLIVIPEEEGAVPNGHICGRGARHLTSGVLA